MSEPEEVVLVSLRDADSDALHRWINDRDLVILNAPFESVARADHDRWFDRIREREDVEIFAIRLAGSDRLIGSCQLNQIDRAAKACALQIRIGERSQWGEGHGTRAVELLLRHAFDELGLETVRLEVFADNQRAIRAYEKAGFERRGAASSSVVIEGEGKDLIEMVARRVPGGPDGA